VHIDRWTTYLNEVTRHCGVVVIKDKHGIISEKHFTRRKTMSSPDYMPTYYTRRSFLKTSISIASAGTLSLLFANEVTADNDPQPSKLHAYNGGTDPYPIPWLDKNGNHNQPAGPQLEPSHIYHFKGRVARCAGFVGMGTDNLDKRIAFGTPTTDYGFMHGEYFAGRTEHTGTFTHI
jgi:hypothetical protein